MTNGVMDEEIEEPTITQFNTPLIGLIASPAQPYQSALVFPEGMENVNDEHFRQFAAEMKEQYEILEDKYGELKMHYHQAHSMAMKKREENIIITENYNLLLKKICKVIEKNHEQYHFGTPTINRRFNVCIPVYNSKTNKLTTYSERTRSFIDIFKTAQ